MQDRKMRDNDVKSGTKNAVPEKCGTENAGPENAGPKMQGSKKDQKIRD